MKLIKKEALTEKFICWDLEVEDTHSYVVSGIVAHNSNCRNGWFRNEDGSVEWKSGSHKLKRSKPSDDEIKSNTYWYPLTLEPVKNMLEFLLSEFPLLKSVTIFGEVYGRVRGGLKSMNYGKPNTLEYVAFSIKVNEDYVSWSEFEFLCNQFNVPMVPVIAKVPFDMQVVRELATGHSVLAKNNGYDHIREGIVVVAETERNVSRCSRAILKVLNPDYLLLKEKKSEKGETVDFTDV